jgi:hypothetical protein
VLRWLAPLLETTPYIREDEIAQAGARLAYFLSCPATRRSMFSAGRELALDPGHGPTGALTSGIANPDVRHVRGTGGDLASICSASFQKEVSIMMPAAFAPFLWALAGLVGLMLAQWAARRAWRSHRRRGT